VLVAAVLRPEEREDVKLEVVGLSIEERDDAGELTVRETEPAMERLFRDEAQVNESSRGPGCACPCAAPVRGLRLASPRDPP
jgi:hypothetical protein